MLGAVHVSELWRYPVKSLRGERLDAAHVQSDGVVGDRSVMVFDGDGGFVTARTCPGLLGLSATHGSSTLVNGQAWDSEAAGHAVREAAGPDAHLAASAGHRRRFDDTPILVATDGAIESLSLDGRRLRPNVVVAGVDGLAERDWVGSVLRAGGVELHVARLCRRCVVTTFDPDTLEQDASVLKRINAELDGRVALNCTVPRPGRVRLGDAVELVRP